MVSKKNRNTRKKEESKEVSSHGASANGYPRQVDITAHCEKWLQLKSQKWRRHIRQQTGPIKEKIKVRLSKSLQLNKLDLLLFVEERTNAYIQQKMNFKGMNEGLGTYIGEFEKFVDNWGQIVFEEKNAVERQNEEDIFVQSDTDLESPIGYMHKTKEHILLINSILQKGDQNNSLLQKSLSTREDSKSFSPGQALPSH